MEVSIQPTHGGRLQKFVPGASSFPVNQIGYPKGGWNPEMGRKDYIFTWTD
jgi:hypothetical protein